MRTLLALVALATAGPLAANDWAQWFARAERAQRSLNFDGVLVVDTEDDLRAFDVRQRVTQNGIEQSLTALDGDGRRLVRGPQGVSVLMGQGDQRLAVAPLNLTAPLLEPLARAYAVALGSRERIAGRDAQRIDLTPHTADRFAMRLWLDFETGLPLRGDQLSLDGQPLERRMLAKLTVLGFGRGGAAPPVSQLTPLRDGFVTVAAERPVQGLRNSRQWLLTDGVAYVSVFSVQDSAGISAWRHGAMAQQPVITPNGTLVVLGNAPDATLRALAEAVASDE